MVSPGWADLDRGLFSISVAAELAGPHPQTLRIYEREGLLDPARSAGGTRRYSRRDIEKLAEICTLTADGLNLAGIRRVLALQEETRQLQAELARLWDSPAASPPPGRPGSRAPAPTAARSPPAPGQLFPSCFPSRSCRRAVSARSATRSSSRSRIRRAAARVCPWSSSSRIRAAKASCGGSSGAARPQTGPA